MPLSYIPPDIREGRPLAKLKMQEVRKIESTWKFTVMLFTPDLGIQLYNIQRYVKDVWPTLSVKNIVSHNDGYFTLQLQSKGEVEEIVNGGPYFMNRRPIVIKHWSMEFDYYSKVLKSYPIWIQLHNIPIECWSRD